MPSPVSRSLSLPLCIPEIHLCGRILQHGNTSVAVFFSLQVIKGTGAFRAATCCKVTPFTFHFLHEKSMLSRLFLQRQLNWQLTHATSCVCVSVCVCAWVYFSWIYGFICQKRTICEILSQSQGETTWAIPEATLQTRSIVAKNVGLADCVCILENC